MSKTVTYVKLFPGSHCFVKANIHFFLYTDVSRSLIDPPLSQGKGLDFNILQGKVKVIFIWGKSGLWKA